MAQAFPCLEVNFGSSGNVFAYNFANQVANTNHAPQNRFNLYEGNAFSYQISDGYFGGESEQTVFRSNFWIQQPYGTVSYRRFTRRASVIGSLHGGSTLGSEGLPNIGNADSFGTAEPSNATPDFWRDYGMTGTLTTRTSANSGVITLASGRLAYDAATVHSFNIFWPDGAGNENSISNCGVSSWSDPACTFTSPGTLPAQGTVLRIGPGSFYPGAGGNGSYQELDLDVPATTINKGNYFYGSATFTSLGGDTLPASLAYPSGQPAWYPAGFTWPPYDPQNPPVYPAGLYPEPAYTAIPAGYRWVNNIDPSAGGGGGGGSGPTITTPTLSIGGTLSIGN